MKIFQREQRSLFGEILDWMLTPLLLLWPVSLALTWLVAQNIAGKITAGRKYQVGITGNLTAQSEGVFVGVKLMNSWGGVLVEQMHLVNSLTPASAAIAFTAPAAHGQQRPSPQEAEALRSAGFNHVDLNAAAKHAMVAKRRPTLHHCRRMAPDSFRFDRFILDLELLGVQPRVITIERQ